MRHIYCIFCIVFYLLKVISLVGALSIEPRILEPFLITAPANVVVVYQTASCGSCKKLLPIIYEIGEKYEGNQDLFVATVDCHTHNKFCENMDIHKYPTIRFYGKRIPGQDPIEDLALLPYVEYNGKRNKEALDNWVENNIKDVTEQIEAALSANVLEITNENFKEIAWKNKHVLLFFYANWNEECKKFNSVWNSLSRLYPSDGDVIIGKINGISNLNIKTQFEISDYPTIIYLPPQEEGEFEKYTGTKDVVHFVRFMNSRIEAYLAKMNGEPTTKIYNEHATTLPHLQEGIEKMQTELLDTFNKIFEEKGVGIQKDMLKYLEASELDKNLPIYSDIESKSEYNQKKYKAMHLPLML